MIGAVSHGERQVRSMLRRIQGARPTENQLPYNNKIKYLLEKHTKVDAFIKNQPCELCSLSTAESTGSPIVYIQACTYYSFLKS
jgi:hypothetical protein